MKTEINSKLKLLVLYIYIYYQRHIHTCEHVCVCLNLECVHVLAFFNYVFKEANYLS